MPQGLALNFLSKFRLFIFPCMVISQRYKKLLKLCNIQKLPQLINDNINLALSSFLHMLFSNCSPVSSRNRILLVMPASLYAVQLYCPKSSSCTSTMVSTRETKWSCSVRSTWYLHKTENSYQSVFLFSFDLKTFWQINSSLTHNFTVIDHLVKLIQLPIQITYVKTFEGKWLSKTAEILHEKYESKVSLVSNQNRNSSVFQVIQPYNYN